MIERGNRPRLLFKPPPLLIFAKLIQAKP